MKQELSHRTIISQNEAPNHDKLAEVMRENEILKASNEQYKQKAEHVRTCADKTFKQPESLPNPKHGTKKVDPPKNGTTEAPNGDINKKAAVMPNSVNKILPTAKTKTKIAAGHGRPDNETKKKLQTPDVLKNDRIQHPNRKCFLIHDKFHQDFDRLRMSKRFDVTTKYASSLSRIIKSGDLIAVIKKHSPEMVFIHVGHQDFWELATVDDVFANFKHLIREVMEKTDVKLCVSLIIPIPGKVRDGSFNQNIEELNTLLSAFITKTREDKKLRSRLVTTNNKSLSGKICSTQGPKGVNLNLNGRGEGKMWLMFRDSLERLMSRSQKVPRTQRNDKKDD